MHYNCKHGLQLTKLCFPYYLKLFATRKAVKTRCHFHLFVCVATGCGEFNTCRNFPRQSLFVTPSGQWVIVPDLYLYFNDSKDAKPMTAVTVVRIKVLLKTDIHLPRIQDKAQILTGSQNTRKSSNLTKISQWHRRF